MKLNPPEPGQYEARYITETKSEELAHVPFAVTAVQAQTTLPTGSNAGTLPSGTYRTYFTGYEGMLNKFLGGDVVISKGDVYQFQGKSGHCVLDKSTNHIIWKDGPLKGYIAEYKAAAPSTHKPAIRFPNKENSAAGHKLAVGDVWAYLK